MSLFGQQMLLVTNGVFPSTGLASPNTEHRASTESRRCNNTNADGDFEKITGSHQGHGQDPDSYDIARTLRVLSRKVGHEELWRTAR
jgi:hypothetical protein